MTPELTPITALGREDARRGWHGRHLLLLRVTTVHRHADLPVVTLVTAESNLRAKLDSGKDSSIVLFGNANIVREHPYLTCPC